MSAASSLYPGLMGAAAYNPLLSNALAADPFRDPYRAALSMYNPGAAAGVAAAAAAAAAAAKASDPLREARERELLRMNPLGSMIMNEQDKARIAALTGAAGLPPHAAAPGFFPPPPPHSSLSMLGAAGFPPHLPPHLAPSAAAAAAAAAAAKTPTSQGMLNEKLTCAN